MKLSRLKLAIMSLLLFAGFVPLRGQTMQHIETPSESLAIRQKLIARGLRGYETSLRVTYSETIVESAIFQSVKMKLREPNQDYSRIIDELKRLSFKGSNPGLRYKAYVAASIMPNPEQFLNAGQIKQVLAFTEETRDEFFVFVAAALQERRAD
ncbi:MAG: hypothetical protein ACRENG_36365 [bacterium]